MSDKFNNMPWKPPFFLYAAGRGRVAEKSYCNDVSVSGGPSRILIKHTLSGNGVVYSHGKRFETSPGDIFVIERPGPYKYSYEADGTPWIFEYISISFTNPGGLLPRELSECPVLCLNDLPELKKNLSELIKLRHSSAYSPELIHSAMAYNFFLSYISARSADLGKSSDSATRLKKMLEKSFLENNTIGGYAADLSYTQEALTRLFSKAYGVSPAKYVQYLRVRHACNLLQNPAYSIKEIASLSGFSDQNYFARVFKKFMDLSPAAYRKNPDPLISGRLKLENMLLE